MTKKTTEPMSLQKIFDTAGVGMLRQGKQSIILGSCRYRGYDGCKCAVGFLIPDDLYDPEIEGAAVARIMVDCSGKNQSALRSTLRNINMLTPDRVALLASLQRAHDDVHITGYAGHRNREDWHESLTEVAKDFGLSTKSIDKVMDELKAR